MKTKSALLVLLLCLVLKRKKEWFSSGATWWRERTRVDTGVKCKMSEGREGKKEKDEMGGREMMLVAGPWSWNITELLPRFGQS